MARDATFAVWAVLGALAVSAQLVAVCSRGRLVGLPDLARRLTRARSGRLVLVLGWMWLGWHAFAR